MPIRTPNEFARIPARHRYIAARAVENVQDWGAAGVHCVAVEVAQGARGKFPRIRRVWVTSAEKDRHRRGLRVPDYTTPSEYRTLIHRYLEYVLFRRLGRTQAVLKPL